jgi:hypothetical protein
MVVGVARIALPPTTSEDGWEEGNFGGRSNSCSSSSFEAKRKPRSLLRSIVVKSCSVSPVPSPSFFQKRNSTSAAALPPRFAGADAHPPAAPGERVARSCGHVLARESVCLEASGDGQLQSPSAARTSAAPVASTSTSTSTGNFEACNVRRRGGKLYGIGLSGVVLLCLMCALGLGLVQMRKLGGSLGDKSTPSHLVKDVFASLDGDHDGQIEQDEIRQFVENMGGSNMDEKMEIDKGVASVLLHLDGTASPHDPKDGGISESDLRDYWKRLGSVLTVDEVAAWVEHAAQMPQDVAGVFRSNMVTGHDFLELIANGGQLLEEELGITKAPFRRRLVRSMQWKLWGVGSEPKMPIILDRSVGPPSSMDGRRSLSVRWKDGDREQAQLFPTHKYLLRRKVAGQSSGDWEIVWDGPGEMTIDVNLEQGVHYEYILEAWNVIGRSEAARFTVSALSLWSPLPMVQGSSSGNLLLLFAALFFVGVMASLRLTGLKQPAPISPVEANPDIGTGGPLANRSSSLRASASSSSAAGAGGGGAAAVPKSRSSSFSSPEFAARPKRACVRRAASAVSRSPTLSPEPGMRVSASFTDEPTLRKKSSIQRSASHRTQEESSKMCSICNKSFRWYSRSHLCSMCHRPFCDRHGVHSHRLSPVCPVGGNCTCRRCCDLYDKNS